MKRLLYLCFVLAFIAGCKDRDFVPDYSVRVTGTYQVKTLQVNNGAIITLPASNVSAGIVIEKVDVNQVRFTMTANIRGQLSRAVEQFEVKQGVTDKESYYLYKNNNPEGSVKGNQLFVSSVSSDGNKTTLFAYR